MELTQEHFDKQISELNNRLDNMATKTELGVIRSEMATKTDLNNALETQTKALEEYADQVGATIIEAIDSSVNKINTRLDSYNNRLETVENEIEQLKVP